MTTQAPDGWKFARELSDALLKVRPLGGSELFVKRNDEYYADPAYCGAAIVEKERRYHEAMKARVRAEQERDRMKKALEHLLFWNEGIQAGRGNYYAHDHIAKCNEGLGTTSQVSSENAP